MEIVSMLGGLAKPTQKITDLPGVNIDTACMYNPFSVHRENQTRTTVACWRKTYHSIMQKSQFRPVFSSDIERLYLQSVEELRLKMGYDQNTTEKLSNWHTIFKLLCDMTGKANPTNEEIEKQLAALGDDDGDGQSLFDVSKKRSLGEDGDAHLSPKRRKNLSGEHVEAEQRCDDSGTVEETEEHAGETE